MGFQESPFKQSQLAGASFAPCLFGMLECFLKYQVTLSMKIMLRILEPKIRRAWVPQCQHGAAVHSQTMRFWASCHRRDNKTLFVSDTAILSFCYQQLNAISNWHNDLISINDVTLRKLSLNLDIPKIKLLGKAKQCLLLDLSPADSSSIFSVAVTQSSCKYLVFLMCPYISTLPAP